MNAKRILRSPIPYILLGAIALWIGFTLITGGSTKQITTDQGLNLLSTGKVSEATIIDGEQRVDMTLTNPDDEFGSKVQFYYVAPRGTEVVNAVTDAKPADGFDDQVPQPNWFLSALGLFLPILLIGAFFWFMLSGMQGGGNRVMQFGKSKAKLVSKE